MLAAACILDYVSTWTLNKLHKQCKPQQGTLNTEFELRPMRMAPVTSELSEVNYICLDWVSSGCLTG
jgi:hypothetical protein